MFKIVLQVPEQESEVLVEPWQETPDPHGPHIKVYKNKVCAETGASITIVRCKHRTLKDVKVLMDKALNSVESF